MLHANVTPTRRVKAGEGSEETGEVKREDGTTHAALSFVASQCEPVNNSAPPHAFNAC